MTISSTSQQDQVAQAQEQAQEQAATGAAGRTGTSGAVPGGTGHWLAAVQPTLGCPVRAPTSRPSPDDALAQVSAVAAWATNAQLAANLAQQSPCAASACVAHTALVAVGRALAVALASYGHADLAAHLELAAHGGDDGGVRWREPGATPTPKRQRTS